MSYTSMNREVISHIDFNGKYINRNYVKRTTYNCSVTSSDDSLKFGEFVSNMMTLELFKGVIYEDYTDMPAISEGDELKGYMLENYTNTPIGRFIVDSVEEDVMTTKFVAYDIAYYIKNTYEASIDYPATLKEVFDDVMSQCNIAVSSGLIIPNNIIVDHWVEGVSIRKYIGYIAGLLGKNAYIDSQGKLNFRWYTPKSYNITRDNTYQNGHLLKNYVTINSVTCDIGGEQLVSGNGSGIIVENPLMTQERLDIIASSLQGFSYFSGDVEFRGDPNIGCMDIVNLEYEEGYYIDFPISKIEYTMDGGLKAKIYAVNNSADNFNVSLSPTELKISKVKNEMLNSLKQISQTIINTKDGYYSVDVNEDGQAIGWSIRSTPNIDNTTTMWKWSMGGLGFYDHSVSEERPINLALDNNGNFYANSITTGILKGKNFSLDLDTGEFIIGERGTEGWEDRYFWYDPENSVLHVNVNEITTSTGFTFNSEGLKIQKEDSQFSTHINENGMYVMDEDRIVLQADNNGVQTDNLTANEFLTQGDYSLGIRFEDFTDSERNTYGDFVGLFFLTENT